MDELLIKSIAGNRVRLKSNIFKSKSNTILISNELSGNLLSFRENLSCKSIVFVHNDNTSLDEIIRKIKALFPTIILHSIPASTAVCGSDEDCTSCTRTEVNPVSFKRRTIEFGLLTGYSIFLFVTETVLGLTVVASPLSLVAVVAMVAAVPLLRESWEDAKRGKFTLETFMGGTLALAILFGEATAAFEIIYILRGAMLLEDYIAIKSKNEIHKLIELDIQKVFILCDGVELEIDLADLKQDDIVVCRSGEKIPVDGMIIDGSCEVNEALINGRSDATYKAMDDIVYAGTMLERGRVGIKVNAIGNKTYISRVMSDVENALAIKSPAQMEADKLASRLLKLGSFLTVGTFMFTGSYLNAFSVMIVMSCPCATVLAASTAISAGIAKGAKQGILIKGGEALEQVSQSEVFCFDKTGTLTTGRPIIEEIYALKGSTKTEILKYAAMAEYRNTHPLAVSIVKYAQEKKIKINQSVQSETIPGLGVKAKFDGMFILVGNKKFLSNHKISTKDLKDKADKHLQDGDTIVYIAVDKKALGFIVLRHEVRKGTKKMLSDLRAHGVKHIALVSGDDEKVANAFAKEFGFDTVYANQSPRDKADAVEQLKKKYHNVVMVGDGVNDTLAMSKADVAISFAVGGSKAAIDVSNIAISHSHPQDVVELYNISKSTLKVVEQNYWIGTGTNLLGVGFAAFGMLSPAAAGAIHIGHTGAIMLNSSRLTIGSKDNLHAKEDIDIGS
ncbi:MAG: cation-translocating P-type ATPase [Sulfurovum sp.]|nr:cation-translocating P-type ATPase [Sulfurovum sp.]